MREFLTRCTIAYRRVSHCIVLYHPGTGSGLKGIHVNFPITAKFIQRGSSVCQLMLKP
jgi:hypothetical protein